MSSTPIDSSEMPSPTPIQTLTRVWNTRIAPLKLAGSWDNVGTMIEAPFPRSQGKARTILLTIDLTPKVYRESLTHPNLGLIISYHPPIFSGLKSLTLSNPLQSSLLHLAASGVSVFAPHTSLDAIPGGMNDFLAEAFRPWSVCKPCSPIHDAPEGFEESGMGRIVHLEEGGLDLDDAVARVKKHLGLKHVQVAKADGEDKKIKTVAMCCGSGGSVFSGVQADLYLTGEMSHHEILAMVAAGKSLILTGHTSTERPYLANVLKARLEKELEHEDGGGWEIVVSKEDAEPFVTV